MRENARVCVCVHTHTFTSREVATKGAMGGGRKEQETSMLGPCDRHGGREWSWGLRLSEYTMNEREKERNEKEREERSKFVRTKDSRG